MSLLEDLAEQLRTTGAQLPIAEVTAATERLRMAGGLLAWVLHASHQPHRVPTLSAATEHLEHAAGAMLVVQEALRDYAVALGVGRDGVPMEDPHWRAHPPPAPPPQRDAKATGRAELSDWWTERVDAITGVTGEPAGDPAQTSADLLHRCTSSSLAEDRVRLRRELAGAGPAVGLGLAAVTPPLLRFLAAEFVGHPPRLEDLAVVRRAALPGVSHLLPAMPPGVAEDLLARVCHAQQQRSGGAPHHPVDSAAAGAVLVAALLRASGWSADDLGTVTEDLRKHHEDERARPGRRRAEPDDPRRAPAVEALLGKAPTRGFYG